MKVLHVSTMDSGGAARGMLNLHYTLLNAGIDSKILVAQKHNNDSNIFAVEPNLNLYPWSKYAFVRLIQKCLRKFGIGLTKVDKVQRNLEAVPPSSRSSCFTSPITNYDLSNHPLVKDADIIHLHWISNFVDFPSFFQNVHKPIVWTLRDENPGLGGFHYVSEKEVLYQHYKHLEDEFIGIKKASLESCPSLSLIALSDVMVSFAKSVDYLAQRPILKIFNLVNPDCFCMTDKSIAKSALGIKEDAYVISFVSVFLKDKRKCLKELLEAIVSLDMNILLLAVGENDFFDIVPENVICMGNISNDRLMSLIYSASDVFVTPSLQESFGKTTIEALLCGTPVISSRAGIANEVINESNGVLLESVTTECIAEALSQMRRTSYNSLQIRKEIMHKIDPNRIVKQHIECYSQLVSN